MANFVEVSKFYLNVSNVACQVKLPKCIESGARISIARVGWKSSSEYHSQVCLDESAQGRDGVRIVIFPSAALPTDKHQYQFVYVDASGEARVASEPFVFYETSPDDSLSSYELIDESRTTDASETRRFQAGSVGKTFEVEGGEGNSPCGSLATPSQNTDDATVEKTPNDDDDDDKSSPPSEIHPTSSLSSSSDGEDEEVDDKEVARLLEENAKCLASSSSSSCDSSDDSDDSDDGGGDDEKDVARVSEENLKLKGTVSILTEQVTTLNGQLTGFVDSVSRGDEFNRIRKLWKGEKLAYEKAEKRNSEMSEELQKVLKENVVLNEKVESLTNRIHLLATEKNEEIESLEKKLEASENQVLNLTEKLEEAENESKEKHEECTDLCRKLGEMEGQRAVLDEKLELKEIQTEVLFSKAMGKGIVLPKKRSAGDEPIQLRSASLEFQDITIATPPSYQCPGGDLSLGEVSLLKSEKRREKTKKKSRDDGDKDRRHRRRHRHHRRDDDSSVGGVEREEKRERRRRRKKSPPIVAVVVKATTLPSAPPDDDNEELPSRCPVCEKPYAADWDGVSRRRHCEEHFEAR